MAAKALTAQSLIDGAVVFMTADGWSEALDGALLATDTAGEQALEARGRAAVAANQVVEAYLVEVEAEAGDLRPARWREQLRTRGPSVRPDLGRQAQARA
jgi:hypothetical protein